MFSIMKLQIPNLRLLNEVFRIKVVRKIISKQFCKNTHLLTEEASVQSSDLTPTLQNISDSIHIFVEEMSLIVMCCYFIFSKLLEKLYPSLTFGFRPNLPTVES